MVDYAKLAQTAKRLIVKNGRQVRVLKRNRAAADTAKPWLGPTDAVRAPDGDDLTVTCVFVPVAGSGLGATKRVVDGLEQFFDQAGLIAAAELPDGTDLQEFSSMIDDTGFAWEIGRVDALRPGLIGLVYAVGLLR